MAPMQDILSQTVTFVLAGGRGARLAPLTRDRSKPAVPFGDRHIIDFALATNVHALRRNTRYVLVLSADHIYEMDYRELLRFHADRDADATLAAIVYPSESSQQFGILEVDEANYVAGFEEKPAQPRELPGQPGRVLANMGIYVFRKDTFLDALLRDADDPKSVHDIGRNVFPDLVTRKDVYAFRFEDRETRRPGYWKDVGTIDSYYEASMEWLDTLPRTHRLAGSGSVIADGVRIHRSAEVIDSILMPGVDIGPGARIRCAILDENVRVMPGAHIGYGTVENQNFKPTSNGILVVPANSIVFSESGKLQLKTGREVRQLQKRFASLAQFAAQ